MKSEKQILQEDFHKIELDSDVIIARSATEKLARRAGLDKDQCREVAISVSEMANNIIKYADHGMIDVRIWDGPEPFIEILAEDRGPGIGDIETAFKEFHTEGGPVVTPEGRMRPLKEGLGCGLAAVQRLMDSVSIWSRPGKGPVLRAVKRIETLKPLDS